jgi:hypothetical protein
MLMTLLKTGTQMDGYLSETTLNNIKPLVVILLLVDGLMEIYRSLQEGETTLYIICGQNLILIIGTKVDGNTTASTDKEV